MATDDINAGMLPLVKHKQILQLFFGMCVCLCVSVVRGMEILTLQPKQMIKEERNKVYLSQYVTPNYYGYHT